jgi:hypothetical protein
LRFKERDTVIRLGTVVQGETGRDVSSTYVSEEAKTPSIFSQGEANRIRIDAITSVFSVGRRPGGRVRR